MEAQSSKFKVQSSRFKVEAELNLEQRPAFERTLNLEL
jgi:hypothetical protein